VQPSPKCGLRDIRACLGRILLLALRCAVIRENELLVPRSAENSDPLAEALISSAANDDAWTLLTASERHRFVQDLVSDTFVIDRLCSGDSP
jgi:hypothetical protein